jgi:hypothetical protein
MSPNQNLLINLIRANQGILKQKLSLLETLQAKYGSQKTTDLFTKICPIVQASIGQHYRHSMDHLELVALVASARNEMGSTVGSGDIKMEPITLNYDLRVRGGTLETDVEEAKKRIDSVFHVLGQIEIDASDQNKVVEEKVYASFMLSGDSKDPEMSLTSTIGRELGFAAHHALHHLAMVKVIATHTVGLENEELGSGFGKAPSTIRFELDKK